MIYGTRPDDPDHVAARGTDAYNAAVQRLHAWVAKNYARGVPLDQLVDRYDDFGNTSHDWKQWTGELEGTESARPMEYMEELWNIGNFQKNFSKKEAGGGYWGDYHDDPNSDFYFNDPGNDPLARVWYNSFGDVVGGPGGRGPEVEYDASGRMYFVDRKKEQQAPPGETTYKGPGGGTPAPMDLTPGFPRKGLTRPGIQRTPTGWGGATPLSYGAPKAPANTFGSSTRQEPTQGFNSFGMQQRRPPTQKAGFSRGFY